MHTGVEVADHGQTFPLQWSHTEQLLRAIPAFAATEAVWERVSRAGGTALVIDPYEGRPPARMVGTIVSGWQFAHTAVLQRWASPRGAYRAFARRFGRAPEVEDVYGRPSVRGLEVLRRQLLAAPGRVARLAGDLLPRHHYDLVWLEFNSGRMAGHHFWDLSHLLNGELDDRRRRALEETVAASYAAIDTALGEVVATLPAWHRPPGAVGERDGREPQPDGSPSGDARPRPLGPPGRLRHRDRRGQLLWGVRAAVPARARMAATRALPNAVALDVAGRLFMRGVEWSTTRAFALPADHDGYIRLNLQGRERDGIVPPPRRTRSSRRSRDGLASFSDDDGRPCVDRVDRVEDLVGGGERSDQLRI